MDASTASLRNTTTDWLTYKRQHHDVRFIHGLKATHPTRQFGSLLLTNNVKHSPSIYFDFQSGCYENMYIVRPMVHSGVSKIWTKGVRNYAHAAEHKLEWVSFQPEGAHKQTIHAE